MNILLGIIVIISLIAAISIVNWFQRLYMKMMGANVMFFSTSKKGATIFLVFVIIVGLIFRIFGIS